jgi:hypothetical protein
MKSFRFSLDRVLAWRRTQSTLAESKLERLRADLRAIRQEEGEVGRRQSQVEFETVRSVSVFGADLGALESVRRWARSEIRRLQAAAASLEPAIAAQEREVVEARRRVMLLERLRERRHAGWKAEFERELAELAGESALAQWRRVS